MKVITITNGLDYKVHIDAVVVDDNSSNPHDDAISLMQEIRVDWIGEIMAITLPELTEGIKKLQKTEEEINLELAKIAYENGVDESDLQDSYGLDYSQIPAHQDEKCEYCGR